MYKRQKQECQIVWFKKDLRINDHRPLLEASKTNIPTIPVYFFETDYWKQPFASKRHWYFIHDSLMDLKKEIKSISKSCIDDNNLGKEIKIIARTYIKKKIGLKPSTIYEIIRI